MASENNHSGVFAQHQAVLAEGRFLIQQCGDCSQHIYFPREVCPHCGSNTLALVAPAGLGTVYSVTTVRRKPDAGGDYNVCLIDLDEGVRLMSRVDKRIEGFIQTGGLLDQRIKGLETTLSGIDKQKETLARRIEQLQTRLFAQFNAMDSLVAQLTQTSERLTQSLASLPGIVKQDR